MLIFVEGRWQVWTTTGEQKDAGTLETVVVVLCGNKQESKPYPLVSEDNDKPFRSGETDQFLVSTIQLIHVSLCLIGD